ncbi:hypothetical protein ACK2EI_001961 [Salmonella enterica]
MAKYDEIYKKNQGIPELQIYLLEIEIILVVKKTYKITILACIYLAMVVKVGVLTNLGDPESGAPPPSSPVGLSSLEVKPT